MQRASALSAGAAALCTMPRAACSIIIIALRVRTVLDFLEPRFAEASEGLAAFLRQAALSVSSLLVRKQLERSAARYRLP